MAKTYPRASKFPMTLSTRVDPETFRYVKGRADTGRQSLGAALRIILTEAMVTAPIQQCAARLARLEKKFAEHLGICPAAKKPEGAPPSDFSKRWAQVMEGEG